MSIEWTKNNLLMKLGVSDLTQDSFVWSFSDPEQKGIGGQAAITLDEDERLILAESTYWNKRNLEYCFIKAIKNQKTGRYKIIQARIDDCYYDHENSGLMELAMSIFHSRAYDMEYLKVQFKKSTVSSGLNYFMPKILWDGAHTNTKNINLQH